MRNSKIAILLEVENNKEEFSIVLQKWKRYFAGKAFKGTSKVHSGRKYIYS